ncbi:general transcription and DNA repair factor IIH subunit TFB4 isoform X2 [Malania oleifera]|uniref:general transcription and DNA repair factor IIH subunit TFB4 isoform X2 n=1 Tax=Malania oleifera TaxID=397392 RepID=UPI0025ADA954|nr:general transcription and DNA repair factor IIH subunit TFB4 isoform X2 [Malania oleifera]
MASVPSKLYSDDVSLLMVLLDTNPFFWSSPNTSLSFSNFLSNVLSFLNSILLLNQFNQVVVIATGVNSCGCIYDSSSALATDQSSENGRMPALCSKLLQKLEEFVIRDEQLNKEDSVDGTCSSLMSGSLSMALCYIQRVFRSGPLHPQPRILCLQCSPDGPEQYVAVMNAIFSAQRSMVPIDSCVIGAQHSAFLQQASYITGGVYLKPQLLDGLFQYLTTVFATDLHSRRFLQLPRPVGVDFRASCFCHKNTIDMGYICSVCLSIFCKHHKKCSTCGVWKESRWVSIVDVCIVCCLVGIWLERNARIFTGQPLVRPNLRQQIRREKPQKHNLNLRCSCCSAYWYKLHRLETTVVMSSCL